MPSRMACQTLSRKKFAATNNQADQRNKPNTYPAKAVFANCLNQTGFTGFTKTRNGKQTIYTFTYKNYT